MLGNLFAGSAIVNMLGLVCAFVVTWIILYKFSYLLPKDQGREFAVNGALSAGKPRGAGVVFVTVICITALIFGKMNIEHLIYMVLLFASMMTGYLDDGAKVSWGELKKGLLDAAIAIIAAVTYLHYNGTAVTLALTNIVINIPYVIYLILIIVLVWVSINVTNCSDGVDGLSGSLSIVTMISFFVLNRVLGNNVAGQIDYITLIFVAALLAYQWFNATPSKLMMGDAGSRAMGFFIALIALKSCPFMYIPLGIVLILDGGLGLLKVSLLRFLKIKILVNVRTPLHDHVRKVWDWSNTQCVFRFAILQIVVSAVFIYLVAA